MKNREIAKILERIGLILEIQGEIVFKIRAYYKASENIINLTEDIEQIKNQGRLCEIPGVGKAIEEKITEYLETGKISVYEKLTAQIPESLLELVHIPSVGPKKAKLFFDELKISNIEQLKQAAESGKLAELPGIRKKTVEKILEGLNVLSSGQQRMNLGAARKAGERFMKALSTLKEVEQIAFSGSLRRGKETIGDIDILVASKSPKPIMDYFVGLPMVKTINGQGETKASIVSENNLQVDMRVIEPNEFGAALLYFTGSKNFNIKLRQLAQRKEMKVSEYGIFKVKGDKETLLASKTEEDCFKALGMPYVPPELREDFGEERIFAGEKLPTLIELKDIKGEFHVHSTYSDGRHSIEEMAEAARARGYEYLAISDHSEKLKIAGGVSPKDLLKKKEEIDRLNKKLKGFKILCGAEVEIDKEGQLDYNDEILRELDIVVAAVHTHFDLPAADQTKRLLNVCRNKRVHILAHPFGNHFGKREPYAVDFKEICQAAADNNVFMEINAFPLRLDLNSSNVYFAKKFGVKFVISTDAHHTDHFEHLVNGISIARRGWLEKDDVLNTHTWMEVKKLIAKK